MPLPSNLGEYQQENSKLYFLIVWKFSFEAATYIEAETEAEAEAEALMTDVTNSCQSIFVY